MLIGTCSECAGPPSRAATADELVLVYSPDNRADHRVHEPWCYFATHAQVETHSQVEASWPREPITRQDAAGMIPCGICQPSLPKATES
jgi:hypothetical protein